MGDELIQINGYPTVGMSHGRAIEIIQAGGNTMQLIVRRRTGTSGKTGKRSVITTDSSIVIVTCTFALICAGFFFVTLGRLAFDWIPNRFSPLPIFLVVSHPPVESRRFFVLYHIFFVLCVFE